MKTPSNCIKCGSDIPLADLHNATNDYLCEQCLIHAIQVGEANRIQYNWLLATGMHPNQARCIMQQESPDQ